MKTLLRILLGGMGVGFSAAVAQAGYPMTGVLLGYITGCLLWAVG